MLHYISDWNEFQFAFDGEISPGRGKKHLSNCMILKMRNDSQILVRIKDTRNL